MRPNSAPALPISSPWPPSQASGATTSSMGTPSLLINAAPIAPLQPSTISWSMAAKLISRLRPKIGKPALELAHHTPAPFAARGAPRIAPTALEPAADALRALAVALLFQQLCHGVGGERGIALVGRRDLVRG